MNAHKITDDNFRQYAIIHPDNLSVKFSSIIGNLAPLGAASVNAHNITDDNYRQYAIIHPDNLSVKIFVNYR